MFNTEFESNFSTNKSRENFVKLFSKRSLDEINDHLKEIERPSFFYKSLWFFKWQTKTSHLLLGIIPMITVYFWLLQPLLSEITDILLLSLIFWTERFLIIIGVLGLTLAIFLDLKWLAEVKNDLVKTLKEAKIMKLEP